MHKTYAAVVLTYFLMLALAAFALVSCATKKEHEIFHQMHPDWRESI